MIQLDNGRIGGCWFTINNKTYDLACTEEHGGGQAACTTSPMRRTARRHPAGRRHLSGKWRPYRNRPAQACHSGHFLLYVWEPAGNRVELANAGARLILAPDWEPVVWTETDRKKGQAWGLKTIETFHTYGTPPAAKS